MSDYVNYFLNTSSAVAQLETLELSHPNFSKTYRIVRNAVAGISARVSDGSLQRFDYYPLKIEKSSTSDDLDQALKITLGDLGELVPGEIDNVRKAGGMGIKPRVVYRTYRSDDLQTPMFGPVILETGPMTFTEEGASFEAKAPSLNIHRTGKIYDLDTFPMLRGFL